MQVIPHRAWRRICFADVCQLGASRDIAEDEELFVIPEDLILSVQNSKARTALGLDDKQLGPWLSLIITMIYEYYHGEQSKWYPYFRVLPTSFDTLMFWTDEQLAELQGSAVIGKIGKATADDTILQIVVPLIQANSLHFPSRSDMPPLNSPDSRNALLSLAHRMGSLIMAYAFDIEKVEEAGEDTAEDGYMTDDEDEPAKGMVPLADIFNADAQRNNVSTFISPHLLIPLFRINIVPSINYRHVYSRRKARL